MDDIDDFLADLESLDDSSVKIDNNTTINTNQTTTTTNDDEFDNIFGDLISNNDTSLDITSNNENLIDHLEQEVYIEEDITNSSTTYILDINDYNNKEVKDATMVEIKTNIDTDINSTILDISSSLSTINNNNNNNNNSIINTNDNDNNDNNKVDDDFDFESWLDEKKPTCPKMKVTSNLLPSKLDLSTNTTHDVSKITSTLDSFFDEIFGGETEKNKSPSILSPRTPRRKIKNYELELAEIVESSFPDVSKLRSSILDAGYIPAKLRGEIWCLLLTGSNIEDFEVNQFSSVGANIENQSRILSDCNAIVNRWFNKINQVTSSSSAQLKQLNDNNGDIKLFNIDQLTNDMYDIIVLYCVRKEIEYSDLFCNLLAPLLLTSTPTSRALASSCFYSIASQFVPLINLQPSALVIAVETVHFWLRLLLTYHNPTLAQHLDRVLPGWEKAANTTTSASEVFMRDENIKNMDGLDELERELGLVDDDDTIDVNQDTWKNTTPSPVNSASPRRRQTMGLIPVHWICGMFTGSMAPQYSNSVLDWALVMEERYAGVYLIISLLEIYSSTLLTMTGPMISNWLREITDGHGDWYLTLPFTRSTTLIDDTTAISPPLSDVTNWDSFICAWIYAASIIQRSTPKAFRSSLCATDQWAKEKINNQSFNKSNYDELNSNNIYMNDVIGSIDSSDSFLSFSNSDSSDSMNSNNGKVSLIDQFKRLSLQFKGKQKKNNLISNLIASNIINNGSIQDTKTELTTMCLWTDAAEVLPCICSNKRRAVIKADLMSHFENCLLLNYDASTTKNNTSYTTNNGVANGDNQRGGEGLCLPLPEDMIENPFYFGIDCRSQEERNLGQFPKAFAMDPFTITDSEAINHLLVTLQPLANTVHLCIIGAGEEYIKYMHSLNNKHTSNETLQQLIQDEIAKLNAVAMFFIKKSFRHVSILDGGFIAAAKYLKSSDSLLNLSSTLVDSDIYLIDEVLGINKDNNIKAINVIEPSLFSSSSAGSSSSSSSSSSSLKFATKAEISEISMRLQEKTSAASTAALNSVNSFMGSLLKKEIPPPINNNNTTYSANNTNEGNNTINAAKDTGKQLLSGWGKRMSIFGSASLEMAKKLGNSVDEKVGILMANNDNTSNNNNNNNNNNKNNTFVIDDEEEDDGMGPRSEIPVNRNTLSKTDHERNQALIMHKMAGLNKGDELVICRENLPGALLFPAIKYKEVKPVVVDNINNDNDPNNDPSVCTITTPIEPIQVHRYLVVTKERFIVLDSNGAGVGSNSVVKSNHHLTELITLKFKKKDPEFVTLFFNDNKTRQYRVSKRKEFVEALQKNMLKFK